MVYIVNNESDLNTHIDAAGEKLVVIEIGAQWCGPCKKIRPYIKDLSEEFKDVVFISADIDKYPGIEPKYDVRGIPTFVFIKNKAKVKKTIGNDQQELRKLIEENK